MAGPRAGPDWEGLQRGISAQVLLPGSEAYQRARPPFTAWFDDLEPQAVVRCAAPQDAAEVIAFARRHGLATATRSGGHSFAGHSSTRGIVINLTPMASVVVADGVTQVGAGVRHGDLYQHLGAHDLTVPAGTCPPVGAAVVGVRASLGLGAGVPELPRPRAGQLGLGLLRRELPSPAPGATPTASSASPSHCPSADGRQRLPASLIPRPQGTQHGRMEVRAWWSCGAGVWGVGRGVGAGVGRDHRWGSATRQARQTERATTLLRARLNELGERGTSRRSWM